MRHKSVFLPFFLLSISCSNSSESYDSFESYDTQSGTDNCTICGGGGQLYNPYTGLYEICLGCNGYGSVKTSNPSFTGGKWKCNAHHCDCRIKREELEAAGLYYCSCGHSYTNHHN